MNWAALALAVGTAGPLAPQAVGVLVPLFHVQGSSMQPTLLSGDFVIAMAAGSGSLPVPGQVVVYTRPNTVRNFDIKRIVGVAGDRVQVIGGVVQLNGQPVPRERIEDYVVVEATGERTPVRQWRETLPNGAAYGTLDRIENSFGDYTAVFAVPAGHIFTMGDNRDNSLDSRSASIVGYIPGENIQGRATIIVFSIADSASVWRPWTWPGAIRWSRLFSRVN